MGNSAGSKIGIDYLWYVDFCSKFKYVSTIRPSISV
jgi:hypothetical protein